ncbi:MAG: alpha/beta fold hydrolase [Phenylobacterium sp.]|uniref:alpha/beta hydrolase n=1 Tax=Phenylobacterium sp. TaxID=1871053 RepID=UPI001A460C9B|nr:alpha/beta fold hydrolase [Phenylobacterium sp.]MBL8554944.1 alpha/beta fold hydrolase [Phenylobacterium sp.]
MDIRTLSRRGVLAAAGLALPAAAFAQTAGPFRFRGWRGQEVDAERGVFEVPEDRRDPKSRRIPVSYVRFRSTAARPGHPIVYLAGGPGGTGSGTATGPRFPIFLALREVADVIAFDQRGTGANGRIPRRPTPKGPLPPLTREGLTAATRAEAQGAWADWTKAGVAMRGYNTDDSADDLEDLRVHLGAEKIHLWGISYGSHLALAALRRHGDRIGDVVLASLEGQDQTVKRPARIDGYLDRVDRLLAADRDVRAAVPDLPALMRRVHARLEADPATLTRPDGTTFRLGGFAMQMTAGALIKNPDTLAMIPRLYVGLDGGRTEVLAPLIGALGAPITVDGMPTAMDLASGVSRGRLAMVEREAKTAVLGDALNFPMPHLLGAIPGMDLGDDFRRPIRIPHRALLIAGSLDGRTPLAEQAEVAAQFRNKAQVLVENAGHDVFESHPEVGPLIVRFFRGERVGDTRLSLPPPKFRV